MYVTNMLTTFINSFRREEVCVNPYHYTKVDQPTLPPVHVPTNLRGGDVSYLGLHFLFSLMISLWLRQ